ncbi:Thioredoxin-like protein CITRX2, chloroplastic [Sesamum alatum]|uniref:Thioredoxin-like protein CITRX2, chloroplastic n=1 Tax=Sesamum alatum TaxID=300844 RepID=A0AAE1XLV0_9LAMI|nr:Thioredoxin-like protein CITRX2, chloroplastic [Sesamum alatum]
MQAAIFSFKAPSPLLPPKFSPFSLKTHQPNTLFFTSTISNRPSILSTQTLSRKLICKPPAGKYLSDDYLVKKISAEEVQELVKGERNVPLIIDFYATWCGPCILMAQELEMLAVEYENSAIIVKVDTDDEYEFARDMQTEEQRAMLGAVALAGEKAKATRKAIMPTGNSISSIGGGGSGGSIGGNTSSDTVITVSTTIHHLLNCLTVLGDTTPLSSLIVVCPFIMSS